jgi:signal transduction histidine kinase
VLDRAKREGRAVQSEVDIDDSSFQVTVAPVPAPNSIEKADLVLTMHDITHFKRLAQLKDDFVSTVSHDLRAPLTSIIGYSQFSQRESTSDEQRQQSIERIETAALRMTDLITDLLDLATLEAGIDHELYSVRLDELARVAIEDLEGAALAKGLKIHQKLESHPHLQGDPRLLTQMWRNLISNAIKYTREGSITVQTQAVNHRVWGQVSDTGIGIAPNDIRYIFDKFYRSRRPFTQGTSGSGLGLALVKSVIERHGGQVVVKSTLNEGATFSFFLPLAMEGDR